MIVKPVTNVPSIALPGQQRSLELLRASRDEFAIDVVDDPAAFAAMREEWGALLASSKSNCLFLTWEWLHTWWKHLGENKRLFIVTLRAGRQLVAIAPLTRSRAWVGPVRVSLLEFAGTGSIGSDYLDFIIGSDWESESITALTSFLGDTGCSIRLTNVKENSAALAVSRELTHREWKCNVVPTNVCPFIDLSGASWESYLNSLGSSHRYNFRRRLRNLHKQFEVRFERADSDRKRAEALHHLVSLHLMRWKERGGSDALYDSKQVAFHESLTKLALERGWLRLHLLTLNGTEAAAFYGFRYGSTYHFYQSGFDPTFEKYSVGLVTVGLTIQEAVEEGAAEYDFLHGDETYKSLWATESRPLARVEVFPPGRTGRLHRQTVRALAAAKKIAEHVR